MILNGVRRFYREGCLFSWFGSSFDTSSFIILFVFWDLSSISFHIQFSGDFVALNSLGELIWSSRLIDTSLKGFWKRNDIFEAKFSYTLKNSLFIFFICFLCDNVIIAHIDIIIIPSCILWFLVPFSTNILKGLKQSFSTCPLFLPILTIPTLLATNLFKLCLNFGIY